jgi:hypothetical protein
MRRLNLLNICDRGSSARSIDYPTPATSLPASDPPPRSVHRDPTRSHPPPPRPPPPVPPPHPQTNNFPDPSLFFQATPGPAFDPFDAIEATPFDAIDTNSNANGLPTPAYPYPASQQVGMQPFDSYDQIGGGAVDPFGAIKRSGSGVS